MNSSQTKPSALHTPGPWFHDKAYDLVISENPDCNYLQIAKIATGENEQEEDANARLIAAAPDLLEASMWRKDPEQKLIYSGATKWARRHCPEVILGVLTDDDVERIAASNASREYNLDDPEDRKRQLAEIDRAALMEYNDRLRAQGVPEEELEPLPPAPEGRDEIPGIPHKSQSESQPAPKIIPLREVEVTQFKSLKGKRLGSLDLPGLEKFRDWIEAQSAEKRAKLPGIESLFASITEGIAELSVATPAPAIATPLEGLLNLMKGSGVSESAVLAFVEREQKTKFTSIGLVTEGVTRALTTAWPDIVAGLQKDSK